jgi:hypothetical protein
VTGIVFRLHGRNDRIALDNLAAHIVGAWKISTSAS